MNKAKEYLIGIFLLCIFKTCSLILRQHLFRGVDRKEAQQHCPGDLGKDPLKLAQWGVFSLSFKSSVRYLNLEPEGLSWSVVSFLGALAPGSVPGDP